MSASVSRARGAFNPSHLEVRWPSRAANIVESLRVIVRGPRAGRGLHTAESFFRLRVPLARRLDWQLTGSFVFHVFLLFAVLAISHAAPPSPARVSLPEIHITWYGPAKDVVPRIAPSPKQHPRKAQARPAQPRQQVATRGYNPHTTVVFRPPHATNRRQLLIEPQAPPQPPEFLPAMPNIIQWDAAAEASPSIVIHANQLRALRGKESKQAQLRAPRVTYQASQGSTDMLPSPNADLATPAFLAPKASRGLRAAMARKSAAAAPAVGGVAPAGSRRLALAEGTGAMPGPPLPDLLSAIHATRRASAGETASTAPTLGRIAPAGSRRLAFAEGTGAMPGPPLPGALGAIHATRAASPDVAAQGSPSVGAGSLGAATIYLPATSGTVALPSLPSAPKAVRAQASRGSGSSVAAPIVGAPADRLVSLSLSPGTVPPPPGNAYAPMSIGPHPERKGVPANSQLVGGGESGKVPGFPAPEGSATGPEGLLILHNGNASAPTPVPQPAASALPKPARVAPRTHPVAAAIARRAVAVPARTNPERGRSRSHFLPGPISVAHNVILVGVVRQDLVNRTIGPWSMPTLPMNLPKLSDSRGTWVLDFASPMPSALRKQNELIVPIPNRAVEPPYPEGLQREGVHGKVVLRAVIGSNGKVSQIRVTESLNPVLDHMAEAAFSRWRFDPGLLNNKAIAMPVIVTVPFHYVPAPH